MKRALNAVRTFFAALWAGKASRVLLIAAGVLLIAAIVTAVCLFNEGVTAANNAEILAAAYDEAVSSEPTPDKPSAMPEATTSADSAPVTIDGHQVMGKLEIPKIEALMPVIAYTDDDALKVSVCYYQGPMPDEEGNLVITGHNFANGAHFGRLDELKKGDDVTLSLPDGSKYHYTVTARQEIKPDDTDALDDYEGSHVLTLMTCTSHGNRRLLVRCVLES